MLVFGFYSLIYLFRKRTEHIAIRVPAHFADNQHSSLFRLIHSEREVPTFIDFLQLFQATLANKRLKKISLLIHHIDFGYSELYSIIQYIRSLRGKGVEIAGYAHTGNTKTLLLLANCSQRYSMPTGEFQSILPSAETFFYQGLFKNELNIEVEAYASGDFKAMGEPFTRNSFSAQARQNLEELILSLRKSIISEFQKNLELAEEVIESPVLHARHLQEIGFFQKLLDEESFNKFSHIENFQDPQENTDAVQLCQNSSAENVLFVEKYRCYRLFPRARTSICIVPLKGNIISGKYGSEELKSDSIRAYPVLSLLRNLRSDKTVQVVLLEIDTGGGSAFASELIYQEIRKLDKEKPVYAYFQNACASGGYYIATACRKMIATPYSITGSIGTVMLRPNLKGFYNKYGVSKDRIGFYPLREIYSEYGKLSRQAKAFLKQEIETSKNQFYERVLQARGISEQELTTLAEGRVFSGEDFLKHKMIDSIASFQSVIEQIKQEHSLKEPEIIYHLPEFNYKTLLTNIKLMTKPNLLEILQKPVLPSGPEYRSNIVEQIAQSLLGNKR